MTFPLRDEILPMPMAGFKYRKVRGVFRKANVFRDNGAAMVLNGESGIINQAKEYKT